MKPIDRIRGLLKRRGFNIYTRPYELNIVALRNRNMKKPDELHVFYKINSKNWNYHWFPIITDPFWLTGGKERFPVLLKQGQYKDAFSIGKHKGKFNALIQTKPVEVLTNYNREGRYPKGAVKKGLYEIGFIPVNALSNEDEGCQVFLTPQEHEEFIMICEKHREQHGNSFTYTLIDFRSGKKGVIVDLALAATVMGALLFGLFRRRKNRKRNR